jgi:hypothetical protein
MLGIAAASAFRNPNKAQCLRLTDCGCYARAVHSVPDKILGRDRESSVVISAVRRKFYLDPRNDQVARPREDTIRW